MHLDAEKEMMSQCVALLGKFIAVREPNIRYLGLVRYSLLLIFLPFDRLKFWNTSYYYITQLSVKVSTSLKWHDTDTSFVQENMTRMLMVTDVQDIIKRHQAQIITSLKDPDIRFIIFPKSILYC